MRTPIELPTSTATPAHGSTSGIGAGAAPASPLPMPAGWRQRRSVPSPSATTAGRLYELGAHPYLLLHFARALDVVLDGTPWPEFVARYKEAVTPHGFPDFST